MNDFDEEEIARAIALSLQESSRSSKGVREVIEIPDDVIEITDDDEERVNDEDMQFQAELKRAMEASKAETSTKDSSTSITPAPEPQPTRPGGSFLLNRAQMELERIERQKRLRPEIVRDEPYGDGDDEEDYDMDEAPSAKRQRISSSVTSHTNLASSSNRPILSGVNFASSSRSLALGGAPISRDSLFWDGELRQTANAYVDRGKDTQPVFRLSEIISPKEEIAFAIVSAYVINWPWFYTFFNPSTPVVVVTHDPQGHETIKEVLPEWIKVTPFLRGGFGCMHMKFMLLFYKSGRLRVVVSTANLIELDWRDIENTVWVQDVPKRASPIPYNSKASDFPTAMTRVLRAVNVVPALLNMQKNGHENLPLSRVEDLRSTWDFSKVKAQLVPSLAGKHEGWPKVLQTGHTALMKAVRELKVRTPKSKDLVLECQGSSIGSYTTQWTNEFYCSARGESAETWLDQKRAARMKLPYPPFKILYPTLGNVRGSALGERGGGTMFCRRTQWQGAKFPRDHFYDSRSKRGPGKVLMHSKMIIATFRNSSFSANDEDSETESETEPEDDEIVEVAPKPVEMAGWAYVGSHNFTPSAWGTLSGSSFNPILNVTNFELGIVFPLKDESQADSVACWERPPPKYRSDDIPWFQNESPFFQE